MKYHFGWPWGRINVPAAGNGVGVVVVEVSAACPADDHDGHPLCDPAWMSRIAEWGGEILEGPAFWAGKWIVLAVVPTWIGVMASRVWVVGGLAPAIRCADGFSLSVQASCHHYCLPPSHVGPWMAVEVGFPSSAEEELMEYAEDPDRPTMTVYGFVPVTVVERIIARHGGVVR